MICVSEPQGASLGVSFHRIRRQIRRSVISHSTGLMICVLGLTLLMCSTIGRAQDLDPRCSDRHATGKIVCKINKPIVNRPDVAYTSVVFAPHDTVYVTGDGCVQTSNFGIGSGPTWKRYVNPSGAESDHLYHGLVRIPTGKLAGTDVGNSLTRIKDVEGRSILVTGWLPTGVEIPAAKLVLNLGYEDDDLSDNGYNDPDDGTEDQCKGDSRNDGGPAHVTVTICRGVPCGPTTSHYDFDVLSRWMDPNGFLLNPHWSWQDRPGNRGQIPSTSLCHEFSKRDLGRLWYSPNFPDCTDQAGLDSVDARDTDLLSALGASTVGGLFGSLGAFYSGVAASDICRAGKSFFSHWVSNNTFAGHVNWFPVTVEGKAGPVTHESGLTGDDDYDFSLVSDGDSEGSLYTNDYPDAHRRYLHVEFDSDETIDHFGTDDWVTLHSVVNFDSNNKHLIDQLFGGHTIMTGLFGLDGEHGLKSELHPLYAMATRPHKYEDDPSDEVWLIFVRNMGDEGFCSSQIWNGGFEDYTFRLPWRAGMTSVEVNWDKTKFEGTAGTSTVPIVQIVRPAPSDATPVVGRRANLGGSNAGSGILTSSVGIYEPVIDAGVYVTFHLGAPATIPAGGITWGPPASIPFIDGSLHLIWTGTSTPGLGHTAAARLSRPGASGMTTAVATEGMAEASNTDEAEHRLEAAINHVPPEKRNSVQKSRAIASPTMPAVHKMSRGGPVEVLTAPPATGVMTRSNRPHDPIAGHAGLAARKLARDAAQIRALCAATSNAPYGISAEVCKPIVRDHRNTPVRDHR